MFNILGCQYEDEVNGFTDAQASLNILWTVEWEIWIRGIRLHQILVRRNLSSSLIQSVIQVSSTIIAFQSFHLRPCIKKTEIHRLHHNTVHTNWIVTAHNWNRILMKQYVQWTQMFAPFSILYVVEFLFLFFEGGGIIFLFCLFFFYFPMQLVGFSSPTSNWTTAFSSESMES